ncbi:MAG TPA: hypothetical protein PLS10_13650 [Chitinophagales bacterium]|nr:hypothetical protein [Chitinophagales bacterium]
MKKLTITRLFDLEEGDRFYFINDKRRIPYQFSHRVDTPVREYEGWKIESGYTTVYYRDDNKVLFEKKTNFTVVFLRKA